MSVNEGNFRKFCKEVVNKNLMVIVKQEGLYWFENRNVGVKYTRGVRKVM